MDLDNYTDLIHESFGVNDMMANKLGDEKYKFAENNCHREIERMGKIVYDFEDRIQEQGWEFLKMENF